MAPRYLAVVSALSLTLAAAPANAQLQVSINLSNNNTIAWDQPDNVSVSFILIGLHNTPKRQKMTTFGDGDVGTHRKAKIACTAKSNGTGSIIFSKVGFLNLTSDVSSGVGAEIYLQFMIQDPGGPNGFSFTEGLRMNIDG